MTTQSRWNGWAREQYSRSQTPEVILSLWEVQVLGPTGWETVSWCATKHEAVSTSTYYLGSGCGVRVQWVVDSNGGV